MRGMTLLLTLLLAVTAAQAIPIDGVVLVTAFDGGEPLTYYMVGDTENRVPAPQALGWGRLSRLGDKVAYWVADGPRPERADIYTADPDGTNAQNVTAPLGGVNCQPAWSPDSSLVAFQRATPSPGVWPCLAGFEIWVMEADGANARRVSPIGAWVNEPSWSMDGYRLACHDTDGPYAHLTDRRGATWTTPTELGGHIQWSPDGTSIASVTYYYGEVGGEHGVWRELILTDAYGLNPQVLVGQFIPDSVLMTYIAQENEPLPADETELEYVLRGLRMAIGASYPQWSPRGEQIMFRQTAAFDPYGDPYIYQMALWLYDMKAEEATQITEPGAFTAWSWGGPNTDRDGPGVTVGTVTVSFAEVLEPGITVVLRDDEPPDVAGGLEFDGIYYQIRTTATWTGPVSICMTYSEEAVPEGEPEELLAILHYDGGEWVDVTIARDPEQRLICASLPHLSPVALHGSRQASFPDVPGWGYGVDGLGAYWAYHAIESCVDRGVVAGYEDGTYKPLGWVDRGQMAVYIARALAGGDGHIAPFDGTPTFPDVPPGFWSLKHTEHIVGQNIVTGYDDGRYHPEFYVTRDQMAVFVARALVAPLGDAGLPPAPLLATFPDVPVEHWAFRHVEYCVAHGVVAGYEDGYYRPQSVVSRDQMAVYVGRALLW